MTLYDQIVYGIKKGFYVHVQEKNGFTVYSSIGRNSDLRGSSFETELSNCFYHIGLLTDSKEEIDMYEQQGAKIIGYSWRPYEPYKVGDLVDISESARECGDYENWDEEKKEMVGGKGLEIGNACIGAAGTCYHVLNKNKTDYWTFRHEWLTPHFSEEKDEVVEAMKTLLKTATPEQKEAIRKAL